MAGVQNDTLEGVLIKMEEKFHENPGVIIDFCDMISFF